MTYEEVQKKVKDLEAERYKKIKEYEEKYETADKAEKEALDTAEKAFGEEKVEAYHKAQEKAQLNRDAMKIYEAKLKTLKTEPIISKEEFNELFEAICEHLSAIVEEDKARVRELAAELFEINGRESKELDEGNMLIEHIQRDLLKDPCGVMLSNGNFVEQPNKVKKFKDYSVISFIRLIEYDDLVSDLAIEKKSPSKYWGAK